MKECLPISNMMNNLNIKQSVVQQMSPNLPPSSGSGRTACSGALAIEKVNAGRKDARITKADSIKAAATTKCASSSTVNIVAANLSGRKGLWRARRTFLSPSSVATDDYG